MFTLRLSSGYIFTDTGVYVQVVFWVLLVLVFTHRLPSGYIVPDTCVYFQVVF